MATILTSLHSGIEYVLKAKANTLGLSSTCSGLLFHAIILCNIQPEEYLYKFIGAITLIAFALVYACLSLFNTSEGLARAGLIALSFNAGVFFSMSVYRLLLHPLRRFPGPVGAKLSRFYVTAASAKETKYHKVIRGWHEKYGDFIRTGKCTVIFSFLTLIPYA